jgi:hypothetical protein
LTRGRLEVTDFPLREGLDPMERIIKQNMYFSVGVIIVLLILNFTQSITIP